jgi:hypothetical protein
LTPNRLKIGPLIGICGSGIHDDQTAALAEETGRRLAEAGAAIVCGGLGGVMAAAAKGARAAGGMTVGVLPGSDPSAANPHIDLPLATGLGQLRNFVIVQSASAVIAFPGGPGTMSEVAMALKIGRRTIGLKAWGDLPGILTASTPEMAVNLALSTT